MKSTWDAYNFISHYEVTLVNHIIINPLLVVGFICLNSLYWNIDGEKNQPT